MINATTIQADDLSFHILTAGDPEHPMLLFLHGFPEYSGAWHEMMARLCDQFYCIAPDQRGYGQSSKPDGVRAYATGKLAGDAAAILSHFGARAAAVVGHDWGASVAYALAIARPDLMDRLIVLNGAHPIPFQRALAAGGAQSAASAYIDDLRDEGAEAWLEADSFAALRGLFAKGMDMSWLAGQRLAAYRAAWARPGALTGMVNWYRATPLRVAVPGKPLSDDQLMALDPAHLRITMPHLLIWGDRDTALLPAATDGLSALCNHLQRHHIPDADHWLHHQKPDQVASLIRQFCQA